MTIDSAHKTLRALAALALLFAIGAGLATFVVSLVPNEAPAPLAPHYPAIARELLEAHNKIRVAKHLPPLVLNAKLCKAAEVHSTWMASHDRMTHGGDGSPWKRIETAGYKWQAAAENIAWNQEDVSEVMKDWMSDYGHRHNVLGHYNEMGGAVAYGKNHDPYWVVDFGTRGTGSTGVTP
jgi:uncharacterized protein YkwD